MAELLEVTKIWLLGLGEQYGVNPIIFASIYLGAIPLFTLSFAWMMRNYRRKKSIVLPSLLALLFFISAYLYLIVAGQNVPWWVYVVMITMVIYGAWATLHRIRRKLNEIEKQIISDE